MRPFFLLFVCSCLLAATPVTAKNTRKHHISPPSDYAYIVNTGNIDVPGYRVFIGSNGRLSAIYLLRGGRRGGKRVGSLTPKVTRRIFVDLAQAVPVNALPQYDAQQMNSAADAPGIHIYIFYHGHQSPDLRLAASSTGKTLYQDVKQAIQAVRLPVPNTP